MLIMSIIANSTAVFHVRNDTGGVEHHSLKGRGRLLLNYRDLVPRLKSVMR